MSTHASREPEMVDGAREPRAVRSQTAANQAAQRSAGDKKGPVPDGKRGFRFVAAKYRLQLTAPQDERLPDGRVRRADRAKVVIADNFVTFLDAKKEADVIEMILDHPSFGTDFFDIQEQYEEARIARMAQAAETLLADKEALADPGVRAVLRAALAEAEGDDFANPKDKGSPAGQ